MPDLSPADDLIRLLPSFGRQAKAGDVSPGMMAEVEARVGRVMAQIAEFRRPVPNKQQMEEILYTQHTHTYKGENNACETV